MEPTLKTASGQVRVSYFLFTAIVFYTFLKLTSYISWCCPYHLTLSKINTRNATGLKSVLCLISEVWPDPWAGLALAQPTAGHSCQTDQQGFSLRHTNSCLLRILWIVISGELLSSQLASLLPLMEGGQRQGKYNYWSEHGTPEPAEVPRFTAGTWHQSLPRYGDHNPVTALLLLSWALGCFFCCKLQLRTNKLGPFEACCCLLKWEESKSEFDTEARWDPSGCLLCQTLWLPRKSLECPFLIKETNIAQCGPERDGG